ncbi:P2Y purinoceptor 14-like protein [Labeo rohita]|uniref:P2Y purinoceptor 14-like protein n=2 Tax=Labeo rohita TaxID=84645 RepID=A0A498ML44_LABRO|nr:P2Y purinoceptor 14 [Labeo rohita]RXN22079.1 P2Y purinoceptor 14-like protein [Labeo rohita]RXN39555.1 P2Y purinoceptor 14-like protein [Labeo rohita]
MDCINTTQTEANNSTDVSSVFTHLVLPVLYSIICACAFILNGLAAWIFFSIPSSSALLVYLKNMVVADVLMLFTYPWRVVGDLGYGGLQLKLIVCRYTAVLFYLCMYTGITFMSLISLERYFKIVCSTSGVSSFLQRVSVAKALALLTWGVMMFFMLPNAILTNQPMPEDFSCMALKSDLGRRWHEISAHFNVGIFWVVFLLMVFCYTSIACHVYHSYKRVQRDSSKARRRSNRSIFSLLAVFVLCFVPYHVCRVPYTFSQRCKDDFSIHNHFILFQAKEATLFLSALNVCLDPVIYFFMCRTFRESLLQKLSFVNHKYRRPSNRHWVEFQKSVKIEQPSKTIISHL